MTPRKLLKKYEQMAKDRYETVYVSQVISDLRSCLKPIKEKIDTKKCAHEFIGTNGAFKCKYCKTTFGQAFHNNEI